MAFGAVLFDLDGTLVHSNVDFDALRKELSIPDHEPIFEWIVAQNDPLRTKLINLLDQAETSGAFRAKPAENCQECIEIIRTIGLKIGILTRNSRKAWSITQERCQISGIDLVITRDEGPIKPDSRSIHPFLEQWRLKPSEIIHVGDHINDLQLASNTGMYSVLIHQSRQNPFRHPCHQVFGNLPELVRWISSVTEFKESTK